MSSLVRRCLCALLPVKGTSSHKRARKRITMHSAELVTDRRVTLCRRAFHISEDVFAGYNHTLRGAQTKFLEYISVGKGRDMGFDSINSFESKVPPRGGGCQLIILDPCCG